MFALAVDRPDDARAYLIEKIKQLKEEGLIHWRVILFYRFFVRPRKHVLVL